MECLVGTAYKIRPRRASDLFHLYLIANVLHELAHAVLFLEGALASASERQIGNF